MRRRPPPVALAALALLPLVGAACGGGDDDDTAPAAAGHVNVIDNKFEPETLEISVGDTVTWDFKGAVNHNVTGPGLDSGNKKSGSYEHTFNSAGTLEYVCTLHPGMKGEIEVA